MEMPLLETIPPSAATPLSKLPALLRVRRWVDSALCGGAGLLAGLAGAYLLRELDAAPWSVACVAVLPAALLAALGWLYAGRSFALYQAHWLAGEGVVLHSGVWWRSEAWVPIARLQHIDVNQGPLDRRWGMASLTLHTAGTHEHATRIDGLPVADAHALRAALLPRAERA